MLVKVVSNGGTFPTARPNGSALIPGDWVKPSSNATYPFTIGSITFNSVNDQAVWTGVEWILNANPFQRTNETPLANKVTESLSGTANYQNQVNVENKNKFQEVDDELDEKVDKLVGTGTTPKAYVHKEDGTEGSIEVSQANNNPNSIVQRNANSQIKVPLIPLADEDATSKDYVDDELAKKTKVEVSATGTSTDDVSFIKINDVEKRLKDSTALHPSDVKNDLTSSDPDKPLSAFQGSALDSKKVNKLSTASQVYVTDANGNQTSVPYSNVKTPSTMIQRDANGNAEVETPTSANQIANKSYVDGKIADNKASSTVETYSIDKIKEEIRINGATFRGAFATKVDLDLYSGTKEKNDRAVVTTDETHDNSTTMYSYNGIVWIFEYVISTKPIELDGLSIDYNASGKMEVKDGGISLAKMQNHSSDAGKVYTIANDGTTILAKCSNYIKVTTFSGVVGDNKTAYYLDRPAVVGTKAYETGLYVWDSTNGFTLIANVGGGGSSSTPIFVGEVSPGDIFPATRPDGSALIIGDYVRPYAGSTFPFTIGGITFDNARDTAVYMSNGNWLKNTSSYQKTSDTPLNSRADESYLGNSSTSNYQSEINIENALKINDIVSKLINYYSSKTDFPATGEANKLYYANDEHNLYCYDSDYKTINDKLVFAKKENFPVTGEFDKLYIDIDGDVIYRFHDKSGLYVPLSKKYVVFSEKSLFPATGDDEIIYIATDEDKIYRYDTNTSQYVSMGGNGLAQYTTPPTDFTGWDGKSWQYIGANTSDYHNGAIYTKGKKTSYDYVIVKYDDLITVKTAYCEYPRPMTLQRKEIYSDTALTNHIGYIAYTTVFDLDDLIIGEVTSYEDHAVEENTWIIEEGVTYAHNIDPTAHANAFPKVTYSTTEPSNPKQGDIWVNPSDVQNTYSKTEIDNKFGNTYTKTESDNKYLPKAGGTMTGTLVAKNGVDSIINSVDNSYLTINGGISYNNGAWAQFIGKDHTSAGRFIITANNGTNSVRLTGSPNGDLHWNGNLVCTRANATLSITTESGFTISSYSALQIAPSVFYVMFTVTCTSAITTKYKKLSSNITINGVAPSKGQVLAGAGHSDGASVTLVYNSSGNLWIGVPSASIAANEKMYFSGILRTA